MWLTANGLGLCELSLHPDYTQSSISVTQDRFYTSAMHIQCFSPSNRNIHQDVHQILHIPA